MAPSTKPPLEGLRIERKPERDSQSKTWLGVVAVVVLLLAGTAFWWQVHSGTIDVRTVTARSISSGSNRIVLNASGYVTARRRATVSSKLTGKVLEVLIEEGRKVAVDQIVARLDDSNVRANLAVAQAQLESTKTLVDETRALVNQANLEFQRTTALAQHRIASPADLDRAEADAKTLQARLTRLERDVTVAERQVALWQQQLDDTIIRAPFAGIVTTKDAQPGEMISPVSAGGGFTRTGIGTIVDMDSLEIEIDVNESYINRVQPGQPVEATLDSYPEWKIPCKVIAIIPTADRQKSTVKVRVAFDALDPRILPEMAVKVAFRDTGAAAVSHSVVIPKSSVRSHDGRDVVFVIQNGRAERRAVTVSSAQSDEVMLLAGVAAGERVVVEAPVTLSDGIKVRETKP